MFCSGRVFYGLISVVVLIENHLQEVGIKMVGTVRTQSGDPCRRAVAGGGPSEFAGGVVRHRPAIIARLRHRPGPVPDRLPDLWRTQRRPLQRYPGLPCADRRSARRQRASGDRQAGLVGDHGRSHPSARYRELLHHLRQRDRRLHWARPGRRRPIRPPANCGGWIFRSSPSRTWCGPRPCCWIGWGSRRCSAWSAARWAACRRCNGPRPSPNGCSRRWRSPARRGIRRRTSPFTNSAGRP